MLVLVDGGGIEILARSVSPTVASISTYRPLRFEDPDDAAERMWPEEWERTDSCEVVREIGSIDVVAMVLHSAPSREEGSNYQEKLVAAAEDSGEQKLLGGHAGAE